MALVCQRPDGSKTGEFDVNERKDLHDGESRGMKVGKGLIDEGGKEWRDEGGKGLRCECGTKEEKGLTHEESRMKIQM